MVKMGLRAVVLTVLMHATPLFAADPQPTNNQRIDELLRRVDTGVIGAEGRWRLVVGGRAVMVMSDPTHDRIRIMSHVTAADALDDELRLRLLQANFDTALDARYAIAQGTLWSVFIHPLGSLSEHDFLAAMGQVVNLANTFGSSYSSGLLVFRGDDNESELQRKFIEELIRKGLAI